MSAEFGFILFDVLGTPMPQGSMKAFNAGGMARMKPSGGAAFAAWRNAVADKARQVVEATGGAYPLDGPLVLHVEFRFPMPVSRPKRTRALGMAPKTTAPDADKLLRCVGDALIAAGVLVDDARFCDVSAMKWEVTGWTGATIRVKRWQP